MNQRATLLFFLSNPNSSTPPILIHLIKNKQLIRKLIPAKLHEMIKTIQYTQRFCYECWNHDNANSVRQLINSRQNETRDYHLHQISFTTHQKSNHRSVFQSCLSLLLFIFSTPNSSTPPISIHQVENKPLTGSSPRRLLFLHPISSE